ncbi:MAG: hypothetical protein WBX11_00985 [Thiobacillaceae bacterium]
MAEGNSNNGYEASSDVVTVELLAKEFCEALKLQLTEDELREAVRRNRSEADPRICHTHDFCDTNMVLHAVFMRHDMDIADEGGLARWGCLWHETWNKAKSAEFGSTEMANKAVISNVRTTGESMIKKGDIVRIKPEWRDEGDEEFTWIALEDEDGGRVRIAPINTGLPIPPNQIVNTDMLEE